MTWDKGPETVVKMEHLLLYISEGYGQPLRMCLKWESLKREYFLRRPSENYGKREWSSVTGQLKKKKTNSRYSTHHKNWMDASKIRRAPVERFAWEAAPRHHHQSFSTSLILPMDFAVRNILYFLPPRPLWKQVMKTYFQDVISLHIRDLFVVTVKYRCFAFHLSQYHFSLPPNLYFYRFYFLSS